MLRGALGVICGMAASALGALILGEYEFTGLLPFVAGPIFGLAIGELVVGVGRLRSLPVGLLAAASAFGGVAWAGWIDSSEGLEPMRALAWVAAALAGLGALVRTVGLPRRSEVG
jgi:hypothetical protein